MQKKALILASVAALAVGPAFAAGGSAAGGVSGAAGAAAPSVGSAGVGGSGSGSASASGGTAGTSATVGTSGAATASVTAKAPTAAVDTKAMTSKLSKAAMHAPDAARHFRDVATGRVGAIMAQYSPHATLNWVGGTLNGTYRGTEAIKDVWQRFEHDMGKMTAHVSDVKVSGGKSGMTVTADVRFSGKMTVPARYVLVYRNHKIVDEVWQLASKTKAAK
ncbi:hypothetical protein U879_02970 [Defluviimonas sp. 20V17]|uniref:SnoaL-like domain-containing protein n=1 Tax=Allgaiera indica TaxID=765699 RepID=A0AAN4UUP5_9RHOB|nr:nuclear transport factor 2 family protein [Allgaiera indica]KDB05163.1 hypothetical protein U879_02970 [Defluviimonas sp. 20V17]GHE05370.1 hypothetical protein GCM10008024_35890 [Allgaiera indica]SDX64087.1 SnoaL-like domain-containing protein [Allgaiera indica]